VSERERERERESEREREREKELSFLVFSLSSLPQLFCAITRSALIGRVRAAVDEIGREVSRQKKKCGQKRFLERERERERRRHE
jgi:hypothetical protein